VESLVRLVMPMTRTEVGMARRDRDPPEFKRRVLDLIAAGRPVAEVAAASAPAVRRSTTGEPRI